MSIDEKFQSVQYFPNLSGTCIENVLLIRHTEYVCTYIAHRVLKSDVMSLSTHYKQ